SVVGLLWDIFARTARGLGKPTGNRTPSSSVLGVKSPRKREVWQVEIKLMISIDAEALYFGNGAIAAEASERLRQVPWHAKIIHPPSPAEKVENKSAGEAETCAERRELTGPMTAGMDDAIFNELVEAHYEALYRFAFSLTQSEAD